MGVAHKGGRPKTIDDTALTYDTRTGWGYLCPTCNHFQEGHWYKASEATAAYTEHKLEEHG